MVSAVSHAGVHYMCTDNIVRSTGILYNYLQKVNMIIKRLPCAVWMQSGVKQLLCLFVT